MAVGAEIARWRAKHGIAQWKLAERADLSRSYVHYVEHGQVLPSAEKIRQIARALHEDPEPALREREREELARLAVDADTALMIKDEFGPLTDAERQLVRETIQRARTSTPAVGA